MPKLEAEKAPIEVAAQYTITQNDIDETIKRWNGNPESKRAVFKYMEEHGRERETADWLAKEYGSDPASPMLITVAGTDASTELSWVKVQKRIAQLIRHEQFYTQEEYDRFDDVDPVAIRERLAENGIENGVVVDPDKLNDNPFIQQVEADVVALQAEEKFDFPYSVGDTVYLEDGKAFIIENVGRFDIQMRDPELYYPVFRSESKENFTRLMERFPQSFEEKPAIELEPENFRITDTNLGVGGPKAKFRMNMNAIKLLKELERDGRQATPEEQEILSKYIGWGGLSDAFDSSKSAWAEEFKELHEALTPDEYEAARASTLNAHYTSPTVIKAIYDAVGNMGFSTGNILEPSCGVGNFFGMLPQEMSSSRLYGVELDSVSGRIAKQIYPKAEITVAGFETTDRRDFYDLAIGNVPFGQYKVNDRAYNKLGFNIHNYFFAKALDQVRPGGVVAFVTSRYTMDSKNPEVRKYLAERADLLGAIRLPNNAFKANAGTEVVSDIIFLQKRDHPISIEPEWVYTGRNEDGYAINSYFLDHPEMVLGNSTEERTAHGMDYTVEPIEALELSDQLEDAVKYIRGKYQEAELPDLGDGEAIDTSIPADPNVKNYSYTVVDGDVYYRENSRMVKPDLNATALERVKGMVELRDCVHHLIDLQMWESDPLEIRQEQQRLNDLYDAFTATFSMIVCRKWA